MGSRKMISEGVQDVWAKLNSSWYGEGTDAFHREYIVKIAETAEEFEAACAALDDLTSELSKELQAIEQSLVD